MALRRPRLRAVSRLAAPLPSPLAAARELVIDVDLGARLVDRVLGRGVVAGGRSDSPAARTPAIIVASESSVLSRFTRGA
jgi:hypothetical protein